MDSKELEWIADVIDKLQSPMVHNERQRLTKILERVAPALIKAIDYTAVVGFSSYNADGTPMRKGQSCNGCGQDHYFHKGNPKHRGTENEQCCVETLFQILEDEEKKWSIQDVTSPELAGNFVKSKQEIPNFGYTNSAYWVRFKLKNDAAAIVVSGGLTMVFIPAAMIAGLISWRKGYRLARYFVIAWSILMFGTAVYILNAFSILPNSFITANGMQIGSALQVILRSNRMPWKSVLQNCQNTKSRL